MTVFDYNLKKIRRDIEEFNRKIGLSYYNHFAYGKELKTAQIYDAYSYLSSGKRIVEFVASKYDNAKDWLEKRAFHYLIFTLQEMHVERELSPLVNKLSNMGLESVHVEGKKVHIRDIPSMLANEESRARRRKLYRSMDENFRRKNVIMEEINEKRDMLLKDFGFRNGIEYHEKFQMTDFRKLDRMLTKILKGTESFYKETRQEIAGEVLDLEKEPLRQCDMLILNRLKKFDSSFPKEPAMDVFERTLHGMGLDLYENGRISVDREMRAGKIDGAFTHPVSVPEDIRVLVKPRGGFNDYSSLLHELGHAEHFSNIDRSLPIELRVFGSCAVTEAFAFVFSHLMLERKWLKKYTRMDMKTTEEYMKRALYVKLDNIRWACSCFKFDMEKYARRPNLEDRFAEIQKEIFFVDTDDSERLRYLSQSNDFYSVNHLLGWILDAQIRAKMRELDENWFENKESGKFLKKLWKLGLGPNAKELAQVIGFDDLDPSWVIRELQQP